MGCGSSSPAEVAENNADSGKGGGGLQAQSSSSSFDLGQLPKKTFTAGAPKRAGGLKGLKGGQAEVGVEKIKQKRTVARTRAF